ncbi:hypothetical protein D3C80_1999640 [compost metagenome]
MASSLFSTPLGPWRLMAWAMAFQGSGDDTGQSLAPEMVAPFFNSERAGYMYWNSMALI